MYIWIKFLFFEREFTIMYRKIIFITINILPINSFTKVTLLIFIASIAFLLTFFLRPFLFNELNKIEFYSLLSAIIILFSGALYICDISDELKAFSFATIILVNMVFCLSWLYSLFRIVFQANTGKLQKIFPKCTYFIIACIMSLQKTKKSINLFSYLEKMRSNFRSFRLSLTKNFEIETDEENTHMERSTKIFNWLTRTQK